MLLLLWLPVAKKKKLLHPHRLPWKQHLHPQLLLLLPLRLLLLPQKLLFLRLPLRKKSRNNCSAIFLKKPPSGGFFLGALQIKPSASVQYRPCVNAVPTPTQT
ncbi:MAG: hypothetical protein A2496_12690 [Burkholderiales bacterium RIFOXYC12_FULL_60_6]|nr:MAG: hypothetical protein A2503_01090 [Burkholderiales bacterium RIFOXYD12_FULL_59_19]OGB67671.1 MAG: hypothetical protein A2496_12690 [Burkholderiales bacterium RIFOXYC12_FULL_60_6]